MICKMCGYYINEEQDWWYPINSGTQDEYVVCEYCHDDLWEKSSIVKCESCGEWSDYRTLHDEKLSNDNSFTPCPCCGNDIVEGMTREEMEEEYA